MDESVEQRQRELMEAVKHGDDGAFEELYDIFERAVYSVALRTVNDRQRAEEVVQDTFVKIWRQVSSFDHGRGAVSAWIFTIAKRTAIDVLRREKRSPIPSETLLEDVSSPDPTDEVWATWQVNLVLGMLPDEQRHVIDLFVIDGYTHTQIAQRLDVPLGTVKTRIYSGLKHLRCSLEGDGLLETTL